jgi:copper chaperone NosL
MSSEKHHVHLQIAKPDPPARPAWDNRRWLVVALAVLAAGLFAASFFLPWWQFVLYAPQYPGGLTLVISLTGMGGDVHEIDLLNHYIGMKHLADAAPVERHLAGYGVAAISVMVLVAFTVAGKKLNKLIYVPAVAFPVVFLLDSLYWLLTFGHDLDPKAPLHIKAFTPQMFGNGQIGQFETFAHPAAGFWLAVAGVVCALAATFVRMKVCAHCNHAGTCSAVCPRLMVLPDKKDSEAA